MLDFTISGHRSPLSSLEAHNTEKHIITSNWGVRALDILIRKTNGITAGLTSCTLGEVLSAAKAAGVAYAVIELAKDLFQRGEFLVA
jgi:hypothetical protein